MGRKGGWPWWENGKAEERGELFEKCLGSLNGGANLFLETAKVLLKTHERLSVDGGWWMVDVTGQVGVDLKVWWSKLARLYCGAVDACEPSSRCFLKTDSTPTLEACLAGVFSKTASR